MTRKYRYKVKKTKRNEKLKQNIIIASVLATILAGIGIAMLTNNYTNFDINNTITGGVVAESDLATTSITDPETTTTTTLPGATTTSSSTTTTTTAPTTTTTTTTTQPQNSPTTTSSSTTTTTVPDTTTTTVPDTTTTSSTTSTTTSTTTTSTTVAASFCSYPGTRIDDLSVPSGSISPNNPFSLHMDVSTDCTEQPEWKGIYGRMYVYYGDGTLVKCQDGNSHTWRECDTSSVLDYINGNFAHVTEWSFVNNVMEGLPAGNYYVDGELRINDGGILLDDLIVATKRFDFTIS